MEVVRPICHKNGTPKLREADSFNKNTTCVSYDIAESKYKVRCSYIFVIYVCIYIYVDLYRERENQPFHVFMNMYCLRE